MTTTQKDKVRMLRTRGDSYAIISKTTGIPLGTIKAYCSRNSIKPSQSMKAGYCEQCGLALDPKAHPQARRFCSARCRTLWWSKNRDQRRRKGSLHRCTYCGCTFASYNIQRKYCSHPCYIASRFGKVGIST